MSPTLPRSQTTVKRGRASDALMAATDTGYAFGYDDATDGRRQCGSAFFPMGSPAWVAYNKGYKTACVHLAVFTGERRLFVEFPAM